jgi:hypothetical protein
VAALAFINAAIAAPEQLTLCLNTRISCTEMGDLDSHVYAVAERSLVVDPFAFSFDLEELLEILPRQMPIIHRQSSTAKNHKGARFANKKNTYLDPPVNKEIGTP